jgi:uroporphyrinogen decarboxylase
MQIHNVLKSLVEGKIPPVGYIPERLLDSIATVSSYRGKVSRLTSLERMLTTIRHKTPDRVPVAPLANAVSRRILGVSFPEYSKSAEKAADVLTASVEFLGADFVVTLLDLSVEASDFGQEVLFPENSTAHPNYLNPKIRDVADYEKIRPIDFRSAPRMNELVKLCEILVKRMGMRTLVSGFVYGPLGVLSMMRGAGGFFKDCMNYPKNVKKACEAVTETLVEFTQAQCDAGVPAIAIDTLYASWNALPKAVWEDLEGPFAREISMCIKKNGRVSGIHNCGHGLYFDAQIRSMEPEFISFAHLPDDCKTPQEMKSRYGDQTTLVGYIPTPLIVNGTPRQVMEECKKQIDLLARDGGYVLAPGCEYPPNISLDNAFALVKAAEIYS